MSGDSIGFHIPGKKRRLALAASAAFAVAAGTLGYASYAAAEAARENYSSLSDDGGTTAMHTALIDREGNLFFRTDSRLEEVVSLPASGKAFYDWNYRERTYLLGIKIGEDMEVNYRLQEGNRYDVPFAPAQSLVHFDAFFTFNKQLSDAYQYPSVQEQVEKTSGAPAQAARIERNIAAKYGSVAALEKRQQEEENLSAVTDADLSRVNAHREIRKYTSGVSVYGGCIGYCEGKDLRSSQVYDVSYATVIVTPDKNRSRFDALFAEAARHQTIADRYRDELSKLRTAKLAAEYHDALQRNQALRRNFIKANGGTFSEAQARADAMFRDGVRSVAAVMGAKAR